MRSQRRKYGRFERRRVGVARGPPAHALLAGAEKHHQVGLGPDAVVEILQHIEPELLAQRR